ncbi:hypothetical protein [Olsenella profusa]|uniref:Uncharacterized protein n=2 Tax=Olsenella TaxID=133925 RepID=U2TPY0_9ACTN|nr:hypothetical protein [Olsenella profusa]ERL08495.1 hypothetical protein HMPREF1316_1966 [Olsenella profusa F0195]
MHVEFDKSVDKAEREDYIIAAAIGASTGVLNIFWQKQFDLSEAHTWGKEKVEDFVFNIAKGAGFKSDGKDLKDAVRFLEDTFPLASDKLTPEFGGGLQHHLRDFAHHPSPVGLLMSILAQFTGKGYGTDTSGAFVIFDLPADALIGKTFPEKLFYGTIIWAGHLVSDMAGSSGTLGEGTGIPGPILSFLKELSALPVFKNEGADNAFSKWISKLFNGTLVRDADGKPIRVDFRTELGVADQVLSQAKSVIANECLVRGYYFLSRLKDELSRNDVRSLKDLESIDVKRMIPTNERSLVRMLTISSSVFVLTNLGIAVCKAAVTSRGDAKRFAGGILLNLNFIGIGRMAVAIASDSKYIAEDLKDYLNKRAEEMNTFTEDFKLLRLNDRETRLLFSYQVIAVEKDIELTKNRDQSAAKSDWLEEFKTGQAGQMGRDAATYFLDEENAAEEMQKAADEDTSSWTTLLALELLLFQPYYPFDDDWKERLKGAKYKNDYAEKDFPNAQGVIDKKKIDEVKKAYKRFTGLLTGTRTRTAIIAGGTVAVGIATAGTAYVLAPFIAPAIAGEAVAGLSGAALTSASLAAVGGGSLAAGGLGMAGGTAIITGGGALLGMATTGGAALISGLGEHAEQYALNQCAQLLTVCQQLPRDDNSPSAFILHVKDHIERVRDKCLENIEAEKAKGKEGNKKSIKSMTKAAKYLERCAKELQKLADSTSEA